MLDPPEIKSIQNEGTVKPISSKYNYLYLNVFLNITPVSH